MKKGVTLKDIAQKLNMSISTVSKSLNDDCSISAMTKTRVKKLASEWNYIPNEAARNFKQNKTYTLGLIIPDMLDQFFVLAINGVERVAGIENYNVIISQSNENSLVEKKIVDLMKRNRVDGLIVAITKETQDMTPFEELNHINTPVVFFARPPKNDSFDYVIADNEGGAFKATDFLIKKGHKRIGHLMAPKVMALSHTRLEGYKLALKKNKIEFDPLLVKVVDLTEKSTHLAMGQYMKMKYPPTGIFSFKNYINLDAIEYLKNKNPEKLTEIDFTGFGNLPLFRYLDHKPLASVEENSHVIGSEAARLLFQKINSRECEEGDSPHQHIRVPCELVIH